MCSLFRGTQVPFEFNKNKILDKSDMFFKLLNNIFRAKTLYMKIVLNFSSSIYIPAAVASEELALIIYFVTSKHRQMHSLRLKKNNLGEDIISSSIINLSNSISRFNILHGLSFVVKKELYLLSRLLEQHVLQLIGRWEVSFPWIDKGNFQW